MAAPEQTAPAPAEYDPPFPQAWQVGDAVYLRYFDASTGRYVLRGKGRIVRIEGDQLVLATRSSGEVRCSRLIWPAWKTRAEGEASLARNPTPYKHVEPKK